MDDHRADKMEDSLLMEVSRYSLLFAFLGAMLSAWIEWTAVSGMNTASTAQMRLAERDPLAGIGQGAALGGVAGALAALTFFRRED